MITRALAYRILSALVLIPVVLAILWADGILFASLLGLGFLMSLLEWRGLYRQGSMTGLILFMVGGLILFACVAWSLWGLRHDFANGFKMLALVMGAVWVSDTMAYVFGKRFGGPKLCPSISPNKTWAGLIGACLGPVLLFLIALPTPAYYALIGIVFGLAGQAGDLSISVLKRRAGVKDTGALIPGHGGLLDRIDSLLFVAPVAYLVMLAVGHG